METEPKSVTKSQIFYAILVVVFVWGSLWIGTRGIQIAANSSNLASVDLATQPSLTNPLTTQKPVAVPTNVTNHSTSTSSLTIMIAGDIMLDRGVRRLGQQYGYDSIFTNVVPLFKQADIVVANLEGPITSNASKTLLPNGHTTQEFTFTFSPKSTVALTNAGITHVSLANNHTDNFGTSGLNETKKWLASSSIQWFGDPRNASSTEALISKNNISVALVGYHAFQPGFNRVLESVRQLSSQGYFVIVMPHWGVEYATSSTPAMRVQARSLVAAGANAIFGSHPHVVEEYVYMGDVPVFYSLGNLIFDQYFSAAVMKGNIAELRLGKNDGKTTIDRIRVYETSLTTKRFIDVNMQAMDF